MTAPRGFPIDTNRPKPQRSRLGAACTAAAWAWTASPLLAGWLWIADLLANLLPWAVPLAIAGSILAIARRRRALVALSVSSLPVIALWLALGRAPGAPTGDADLRVLQLNALTGRGSPEPVLSLLLATSADVVAITEAPRSLLERLRADPEVQARFPYRDLPPWDLTHTRLVLSRTPLEPLIDRAALAKGDARRAFRLVRVEHERGPFVLLTLQPASPRTPARWREGNALVGTAIESLLEHAPDEPIILLADLNSTPSGFRSRLLWTEMGLRRCKPLAVAAGTYPAGLPWPLTLAIDDAWVSRHWRVAGWRTISGLGSDHRAVEVGLRRGAR